jgi:hypothetical protein
VLNTLEQYWGGLCTHVREDYDIGKPPYGYKAKVIPHPNPVKAAKGLTKSRLAKDGTRGETVTQIAHWRCARVVSRSSRISSGVSGNSRFTGAPPA